MYYFAYGSNMNLAHMRRLCGWNYQALGPAQLLDYEFGLDLRGYNNIRPQKGAFVWGVLFELQESALKALDEFEGYPEVFTREEVYVTDNQHKKFKAWVYRESPEQFGGMRPHPEYFSRILAGARENFLPESWIKKLEGFLEQEDT